MKQEPPALSTTEVDEFQTTGKLLVHNFFTADETKAMQLEVNRWLDQELFRDVSTDARWQNLQCIPLHPKSELFKTLGVTPKVTRVVEVLLGGPVLKILDQSFYKPALTGGATDWHTDNAYFQMSNPLGGLAIWIAIHDATRANGCLKVVPNVYKKTFIHKRDPRSDHHIHTDIDEEDAFYCELEAGGVVFFSFGTPHATGDNPSVYPRAGVGMHYVNMKQMNGPQAARWRKLITTEPSALQDDTAFNKVVSNILNP